MPSPHKTLQHLEDQRQALDESRTDFLNRLSQFSSDELISKPHPNRWSLLEVAQHLMLAERGILRYLPERAKLRAFRLSWRNRIMEPFVYFIMRAGVRATVPQHDMVPDGNTTLEQIRGEWQVVHDWLEIFIGSMTDDEIQKAYFVHPVSGPVTAAQTLRFFRVHFDQHMRKIEARITQLAED